MGILTALKMLDGYHRYTCPKQLTRFVERATRLLEERGLDFDTIAVQGVSGLMPGAPLAMALGKELMVIRKPGDKTHCIDVLGVGINQKILLLDDCVESGATLSNMLSKIKTYSANPTVVGLFLYTGKYPKTQVFRCGNELIDVITF